MIYTGVLLLCFTMLLFLIMGIIAPIIKHHFVSKKQPPGWMAVLWWSIGDSNP